MATYGDESLDNYFYSSYNPYSRYPKPKVAGWKYKNYLSNYGDAEAYFDSHQMQLKSILSQINPKLAPRLRKANTRDVAVQVNPKIDASVQCSIGPRTLLAIKRDALRKRRQDGPTPGSPTGSSVRYPRTLAVYSPIAYRSVTSFDDKKGASSQAQTSDSPEPVGSGKDQKDEDDNVTAEDTTENAKKPAGQLKKTNKTNQLINTEDIESGGLQEGSKVKARVRFQVSLSCCQLS